jgi:hypothetical protein
MLAGGLALGGIALAGVGGPVKGAAGGAMTGLGVAMGLAQASAFIPALLPMLTIPGFGWIAAGVGALIGGIVGLFSRGKQKKKAAALEAQYEAAADQLVQQYMQHEVDYSSALDQLQQVLASGSENLNNSGTGKWGRNAAGALAAAVGSDLDKIEQIEKARQTRSAALGGMSVPEFAVGGLRTDGGMLAIVHPGEFVMRKSAVDSLGVDFLAALNRAPRFANGGAVGGGAARAPLQKIEVHLHVQAIDGESVAKFFRNGKGYIVKTVREAVAQGAF